jgi:hypothetical protein
MLHGVGLREGHRLTRYTYLTQSSALGIRDHRWTTDPVDEQSSLKVEIRPCYQTPTQRGHC